MLSLLRFMRFVSLLKNEVRAGWNKKPEKKYGHTFKARKVENPESVAAHTYGALMLWFELADFYPHLDRWRVACMLGLHDLQEQITRDLVTATENGARRRKMEEEKHQAEREAMRKICERVPNGKKKFKLWEEFADQSSEEAVIAKQVDRIETVEQAVSYREQGQRVDPQEFIDEVRDKITDPILLQLLEALEERAERIRRGTLG